MYYVEAAWFCWGVLAVWPLADHALAQSPAQVLIRNKFTIKRQGKIFLVRQDLSYCWTWTENGHCQLLLFARWDTVFCWVLLKKEIIISLSVFLNKNFECKNYSRRLTLPVNLLAKGHSHLWNPILPDVKIKMMILVFKDESWSKRKMWKNM